jgi:hypothetical protein
MTGRRSADLIVRESRTDPLEIAILRLKVNSSIDHLPILPPSIRWNAPPTACAYVAKNLSVHRSLLPCHDGPENRIRNRTACSGHAQSDRGTVARGAEARHFIDPCPEW